jgi:hypothetical protein
VWLIANHVTRKEFIHRPRRIPLATLKASQPAVRSWKARPTLAADTTYRMSGGDWPEEKMNEAKCTPMVVVRVANGPAVMHAP